MQGHRTLKQYRAIDLSLFAIILIVFESILIRASREWFPAEPWTVSATAAVTAVVMVRWGPWAALHAVLGGIVLCVASRGGWQQYLIYCIGNTAALGVLPLVKKWGWENLRKDSLKVLLYGALTLLLMQAGRAAAALVLGTAPERLLLFITTDSVTYIFTLVILWITSRLDGMLEDQRHYLIRISDPERKEGGFR